MPNEFATSPQLDQVFPRLVRMWTCPITGIEVPKDPMANLKWRAALLAEAENDPILQQDIYTACSKSLLLWVNMLGFTLRVFEPGADGRAQQAKNSHIPFVTWEIQDKHLLAINEAIETGHDLLTDKSRDMGATWDHIAVLTHRFLFRSSQSFLVISRKEDAVDQPDANLKNYPFGALADPGTLFGKTDYMLKWLPTWMLPRMSRKKLHLVNLDNSSRMDGESANASAGSSDRRTAIFLDEMAKMREGESIKRSTRDVSACRLPCSTPDGPGTSYSKWRLSGTIPVFILPWWEHPEKGANRYIHYDEQLRRYRIRSPWYDLEAEIRSPKELAIEVDMDHIGSGDTFFEGVVIAEHQLLFGRDPLLQFDINFNKKVPDTDIPDILRKWDTTKVTTRRKSKGMFKLWAPLHDGRVDQTKTYIVGCDISMGQGASNSTASVLCLETGEKIGAFADANTPPFMFARMMCALCLWLGGRKKPYLIWENNGNPGFDFNNLVVKSYEYPNVYFDRQEGTTDVKVGKRWGWRSSNEKKAAALGAYRRALAHGEFINHDKDALEEALTYIQFDDGTLGPAQLVEESSSARKTHGDRVIADALTLVAAGVMQKPRTKDVAAPHGSFGDRFKKWQHKQAAAKNPRTRFYRISRGA